MSDNKELNNGHYFQLLDRVSIVESNISDYIYDNPVFEKHPKLKRHLDKALESLGTLYQEVGQLDKALD